MSRIIDLSTRVYFGVPTDLQFEFNVDYFIAVLHDAYFHDYLRQRFVYRRIKWQIATKIAQASWVSRTAENFSQTTFASFDAMFEQTPKFTHFPISLKTILIYLLNLILATGNLHRRNRNDKLRDA